MDALLTFFKKNTGVSLVIAFLFPIGAVLLYNGIKSIWIRQRNKKETAAIYDFMLRSDAYDRALTNDEIIKATGVPRDRVIHICADHKEIRDAGKRQRSWRLKKEGEADEE